MIRLASPFPARLRPAGLAVAAIGCGALWSPVALAGDAALSEALFREGKALMGKGDYEHACPKLEESYRQDPATGTLLALAACQERWGKLASAWATYTDVAARSHQEGRADREKVARTHAEALAPRLSSLTLDVPPDVAKLEGFTLSRDGVPVPRAAWSTAVPIDPGEHRIEATATGKQPFEQTLAIGKEPAKKTLTVPMLADSPTAPPIAAVAAPAVAEPAHAEPAPPPAAPASVPAEPPPPAARKEGVPWRTVGYAVGGVGIAAVGIGAFFGVKAKSKNDDSNADGHCDSTGCDQTGYDLRNDARAMGNLSTGFVIGGAALLAGGITLYFVGAPKAGTSSAAASLHFTPSVAPGSARFELGASF